VNHKLQNNQQLTLKLYTNNNTLACKDRLFLFNSAHISNNQFCDLFMAISVSLNDADFFPKITFSFIFSVFLT